jgi:UDP-glucose:(heptosyl)LPS alpha-1,3-glucosyltransferase
VQNFVLAHTCHATRGWETLQSQKRLSGLRRRLLIARNRWATAMERKALRRCPGRVIAVSPSLSLMLSEAHGIPLDQIFTARNGVDQELFNPANRAEWRAPIRRELGLAEEDLVLLFVGGLWREKGLLQTLQALAGMSPPAHLLVLGRDDEATFSRHAADLGVSERVHFLGRQPNVERYYAAADVFAFPSPIPGLALATVEAAASGLPLVVARLEDTEEFFGGERGALLVGPSGEEMAAALDRLAADPELRRTLGERARKAVAPLRWDLQAEALEAFLLRQLAAAEPGGAAA